jgi:hypothetical protein
VTKLFMVMALLITIVAAGSAVAGETVLLKNGFDSGQLALTFTAKEEGAKLELKVKNQTNVPLIVSIESGTTTFHLGQQTIVISTSKPKTLNVGASSEVTVLLEQGGGARMTKGSMTVSKKPPKK